MNLSGGGDATKWLSEIGVSDAPLCRAGLATALKFFDSQMPSLPRETRLSFLKAMDLHKPVKLTVLAPPAIVAAWRKDDEDPLKLFYTKGGTSVHALGVDPSGRSFVRFRVLHTVPVLESITSGFRVKGKADLNGIEPPPYVASGGGIQYVIPNASQHLDVI